MQKFFLYLCEFKLGVNAFLEHNLMISPPAEQKLTI